MDKEDLYTLNINCKGKRTVGKANKRIKVEKNKNRLKNFLKENNNQKIKNKKK